MTTTPPGFASAPGFALPSLSDVREAHSRINPYIHRTAVLTSSRLDAIVDAKLFFKCENFQRSGAFKARGAYNAIFALPDALASRGVVTHSSGNHGTAVALAAQTRGIAAHIVVPENTSDTKVQNIRRYGGRVVFCKPTLADREAAASRVQTETGAHLIHSYDNGFIIAGQGTAALELLQDEPGLDAIVAPVGGGGLLSGVAIASKGLKPDICVLGAEPETADDAAESLRTGKLVRKPNPVTIADGLRVSLSEMTFAVIRQSVNDILTVSESEIVDAMRLIWSVLKIIIEPSSAVAVAAVMKKPPSLSGKRVGVILSGGNVDLDHIPWSSSK